MRELAIGLGVYAAAALSACGSSADASRVATSGVCTGCHGDASHGAAPPFDTHGLASSAAVGAHLAHVTGGVACDACHVVPAKVMAPGHLNGIVEVVFGPIAHDPSGLTTPTYSFATQGCSNVYCHSRYAPGNTPTWVQSGTQSGCGTCHAANGAYGATGTFTGRHSEHRCSRCHDQNDSVGCFACHAGFKQQVGTAPPVVDLPTHVDGIVEIAASATALGRTITDSWDPASRSCTTSCHSIGDHRRAGAPAGSSTWP
jgi:predicted CxxxxCH...CXXCH cytochrome family protein